MTAGGAVTAAAEDQVVQWQQPVHEIQLEQTAVTPGDESFINASASSVPGFAYNQDAGTFWHGTHVAGIIAARDNSIGTIGVAPNATVIGVKVLHDGGGSFGAVVAGLARRAVTE